MYVCLPVPRGSAMSRPGQKSPVKSKSSMPAKYKSAEFIESEEGSSDEEEEDDKKEEDDQKEEEEEETNPQKKGL